MELSGNEYNELIISVIDLDKKPLERLTHKFCEFLLEQALSSLMLSKDSNEYYTDSLNSEGSRALDLLHTMTDCVQNSRKSRSEGTAR